MVNGAGDVTCYGNQATFLAEDFEQTRGRSKTRWPPSPWPQRLGKFKCMAVPHRGFLSASHEQFRAVGKKGFQRDDTGFHVVLLRGFLETFQRDSAI